MYVAIFVCAAEAKQPIACVLLEPGTSPGSLHVDSCCVSYGVAERSILHVLAWPHGCSVYTSVLASM